jgi:tetratricopeptide (TPR) repeat protein
MGSKHGKRRGGLGELALRENALLNPAAIEKYSEEVFERLRRLVKTNLPEFQALVLADQAEEAEDPAERTRLAREATRIDPDCAKAYRVLAMACEDPREALPYCERAVAAGERLLRDLGVNLEGEGVLTGRNEALGYLQSRFLLARCLLAVERVDEGLLQHAQLLRLDHDDTVKSRYPIALMALIAGKLEILDQFLKVYAWDRSGGWLFVRVILEFKRGGDSWPARKALNRAMSRNPRIAEMLLNPEAEPPAGWEEGPDAEKILEATGHCIQFGVVWRETEGALAWLASR